MLSGEIATLLSGRYVEIEVLPLSFKEYVSSFSNQNDLSRKYRDYLEFGSFPYALELNNDRKLIRDYLSGVYSTVVLKDVVARNKVTDVMMLESVIRFLFHNIGNIASTKKISDTMTSDGRKISTPTVESYIKALMGSLSYIKRNDTISKGSSILKL